jgi:tRNA-dihydrouridine synthase A
LNFSLKLELKLSYYADFYVEPTMPQNPWAFCIAPMIDWTDRHFRFLMRLCAKDVRVYTEMITTGALIFGDKDRHLAYSHEEHPIALQLGGSDRKALAQCAKLAVDYHYDEVNLNVGCPSDRVQSGQFGACLMKQPQVVAQAVAAMREAVDIPITVKTRIGVDDFDSYEFLTDFIGQVNQAGCNVFILHARKAWLQGLSPKENREIPPLCYPRVYQIKKDFPDLTIVINGGITSLDAVQAHFDNGLDGVMIGREAYQNPYHIARMAQSLFSTTQKSPHDILQSFLPYIESQLQQGTRLQSMTRHILNLFNGMPNAKSFRRYLSQNAYKPGAGIELVEEALKILLDFDPPSSACRHLLPPAGEGSHPKPKEIFSFSVE